jgi:hypothetical protein
MDYVIPSLSALQTFEDNMRPATLLLRVFRLLDSNDTILTEGQMVEALRPIVRSSTQEDLMLIYNEVFLGLIRERAQLPASTLRQTTLRHLLRQAVVASCTALETYLPALLRANLPVVLRAKGRDFVPRGDEDLMNYFSDLQFSLDETLRLLSDENAVEYISNKILGLANFKYLSSRKGIHVVGALLDIQKPWNEISDHLGRDKKELMNTLDETVRRRNDIVHRADRAQSDPTGEPQEITFAWTQHATDTISHICLALDELVARQIDQLRAYVA